MLTSSNKVQLPVSTRMRRLIWMFFILAFVAPGQATAQEAPQNHARVELVAEESSFQPGREVWIGVLFRLDPGWHVYWQNPGDSGTPPQIHWGLPAGFQAGAVRWPLPIRLGSGTVIDYGYEDQVLLMASVKTPSSATAAASVAANVKYVVCRELCIPGKVQLSLSIPLSTSGAPQFSASRTLFEITRSQFPKPAPFSWKISAQSKKGEFVLTIRGAVPRQGTVFFPADAGVIDNPSPQIINPISGGFTLALKSSELLTKPVAQLHGVLDLPGLGAFEIAAPVTGKQK